MATATPTASSSSPSPSPSTSTTTSTSTLSPDTTLLLRNLSIAGTIVCPIILLLPPRKLDWYTFSLVGFFVMSSNHVVYTYSGSSIMQRFEKRMMSLSGSELPEKARVVQERLRREKEIRENGLRGVQMQGQERDGDGKGGTLEEVARLRREEKREMGVLQKMWYGDQGPDWKRKRDEREKEALEEGKGYGGLIMDQILEVWSGGKGRQEVDAGEGDRDVKEEGKRRDKTDNIFEQKGKGDGDKVEQKKKQGRWSLWASK